MNNITINELNNKLKNGFVHIDFTKSDGSERSIDATLQHDFVEKAYSNVHNRGARSNNKRDDRLIVVDRELGEFRTVIIDNIKNIVIDNQHYSLTN